MKVVIYAALIYTIDMGCFYETSKCNPINKRTIINDTTTNTNNYNNDIHFLKKDN